MPDWLLKKGFFDERETERKWVIDRRGLNWIKNFYPVFRLVYLEADHINGASAGTEGSAVRPHCIEAHVRIRHSPVVLGVVVEGPRDRQSEVLEGEQNGGDQILFAMPRYSLNTSICIAQHLTRWLLRLINKALDSRSHNHTLYLLITTTSTRLKLLIFQRWR